MTGRTPRQPFGRRAPQTGFTIVELMVGVVIGLLGVLGMISLYLAMARQVDGTPGDPGLRQRSHQDGQIALAMVTLQYDLQRAGFGVEAPTWGADLLPVPIPAGSPVDALSWRWKPNPADEENYECAAMRYRATDNVGAANETGVVEIIPRAGCLNNSDLPTPSQLFSNNENSIQTVATNVPELVIKIDGKQDACYIGAADVEDAERGLQVTFQTRLSLGGLPSAVSFCIFNITS